MAQETYKEIPKRTLGKTGQQVTILGLGGEGILRTYGYQSQAVKVIHRALDLGINYLESARAYADSEIYYGLALKDHRHHVFLASKSHDRTKKGAQRQLETTLHNMKTDYLDLWQVHDVRSKEDLERIFSPYGAIEAFREAKEKGLIRFIGITGHEDPKIVNQAMEMFEFDTALIPINPAEPYYGSFLTSTLPKASGKDMGIIGMKVLCRGFLLKIPYINSIKMLLHFALSQLIHTVVIGADNTHQLEELVSAALSFKPMNLETQRALIQAVDPYARELMYYKPTAFM